MRIVVYVEGEGDRLCLETLLAPLLQAKEASGVHIGFVPMTRGDRKKTLLIQAPLRAVNAILNDPDITVVIVPDLYPRNKAFDHVTCEQMQTGVRRLFLESASRKHGWEDRYTTRFRVFCMIHDLEVLLLAAEEQLMAHCGLTVVTWTKPVEEQNQENPPKRIVEKLIRHYNATVDGPLILANADYRVIANRCPNGFGQFVAFLETVS